jgi:hypothetical protein
LAARRRAATFEETTAMRGSTRALVLTAALAACAMTSAHADDASSLEERMSYKDFTRLGLDKLSPEQLKGLNEWMKAHGGVRPPAVAGATGAAPASASASVPAAEAAKHSAKLVGEFKGWEKGTVLRLADGSAWEVRDDEPFIAHASGSPVVTVDKSLVSGWRLSVAGYNEMAHVIPAK